MIIDINKDFLTEYKDDLWKGFSGREIGAIVVAGGVAAGVVALISVFSGMKPSDAVYIGLPVAIPILLSGFYKYQGYLRLKELMKEIIYTHRARHLYFESPDNDLVGTRRFSMKRENNNGSHNKR